MALNAEAVSPAITSADTADTADTSALKRKRDDGSTTHEDSQSDTSRSKQLQRDLLQVLERYAQHTV